MSTGLSGFFSTHVADYRQGRTERMAKRYSLPLVLSLDGQMRLLHGRADIRSALDRARQEFSPTTLRGARLAMCQTRKSGARTKVLIRYESRGDVAPISLTYFVTRRGCGLRIEMIELSPRTPFGYWYRAFSLLPGESSTLSPPLGVLH